MRALTRPPRLAVLIGAENIPAHYADALLLDTSRRGDTIIRRAYGDFTQPTLAGWAEACPRLGILPQHQIIRSSGRNAADIALVIDAMDLLHRGEVESFCLASSDADFTRLALRLREAGAEVVAYGERKTSEPFRRACHDFIEIEALAPPPGTPQPPVPIDVATPVVAATPIQRLMCKAIGGLPQQDGWVAGSPLGMQLRKLDPGFTPAAHGSASFRKMVETIGGFETRLEAGLLMVRFKPPG